VVIDTARPPASTAVQVAALFAPGYLLEVEACFDMGRALLEAGYMHLFECEATFEAEPAEV
jgi:hypothetical protein